MPSPTKTAMRASPHSLEGVSSSGGERAPLASSVAPHVSAIHKTEALPSLRTISSTHKRLLEELGQDAHLLDFIPIAGVTMAHTTELEQCLTQKILVGSFRIGSQKLRVWAFLSAEIRAQNNLPHIMMYAGGPGTHLIKCTSDKMDDPKIVSWIEAFRGFGDSERRSVLIKTCFILKGADFPSGTQFTSNFLKELKALCRSFRASNPEFATSTPPPSYQKSMMARKTQQASPDFQLFSLTDASTPRGCSGLHSGSNLPPAQLENSPPTEPAAMRKDKEIKSDSSLNSPSSASRTSRPLLYESMRTAAARVPSPYLGFKVGLASARTYEHRDDGATAAKVCMGHPKTAPTPTLMAAVTPTEAKTCSEQGTTNELSSYHAARGDMNEILEELGHIEAAARRNKKKYDHLRDEMKRSIDVDMKERHKREIKDMLEELAKQHKAEESAEKAKYRTLVAAYEYHRDSIDKQRDDVLLRKSELSRHLKRKRESLSREELLACLEQDADEKHT